MKAYKIGKGGYCLNILNISIYLYTKSWTGGAPVFYIVKNCSFREYMCRFY